MARSTRSSQVRATSRQPKRTRRPPDDRSCRWVFTINMPTDGTVDDLRKLKPKYLDDTMRYMVFQMERGEEMQRPHYQGYVHFFHKKSMLQVKDILCCNTAHIERAMGTFAHCRAYCTKEAGRMEGPWEFGNALHQGKRVDIEVVKQHLNGGGSLEWVRENYYALWLRNRKSLEQHHDSLLKQRDWKTRVIVVYGPAGSGKTKWVSQQVKGKEAYWKSANNRWFNGYERHELVVFDDFSGRWMEYELLKRIMDRYPCPVEPKNRMVHFVARKLYITTNIHPNRWYPKVYDARPGSYREILRRIDELYYKAAPSAPLSCEKNLITEVEPKINMDIVDRSKEYDEDGNYVGNGMEHDGRPLADLVRPRSVPTETSRTTDPMLADALATVDRLDEDHFHVDIGDQWQETGYVTGRNASVPEHTPAPIPPTMVKDFVTRNFNK